MAVGGLDAVILCDPTAVPNAEMPLDYMPNDCNGSIPAVSRRGNDACDFLH
jgi:hypothetical protein